MAGKTALHLAAESGHLKITQLLLNRGANPDSRDRVGQTPLYTAISERKVDLAKALLDAGAEPNVARHGGDSPLHLAIDKGSNAQCAMLVAAGAKSSFVPDPGAVQYSRTYLTPFQSAVYSGSESAIMLLHACDGEDLHQTTLDGRTLEDLIENNPKRKQVLLQLRTEAVIRQGIDDGSESQAGSQRRNTGMVPL